MTSVLWYLLVVLEIGICGGTCWWYSKSVFVVVPVGGTRCVTSTTDHCMNIHARITLTAGLCIQAGLLLCFFDVYNDEYDQD